MKKFFKRLLVTLVVLLVLLGAGAGVVYYLYQGTPDWLPAPAASAADQAAAAKRAQDTMESTVDWASTVQAEETRSRTGTDDPAAATSGPPAARSREVAFKEQEINALFHRWDDHSKWHERYGQYMTNPAVALYDEQIIFLGEPKNLPLKTEVASLHFKPSLDARGGLHLPLVSARAGRLPIPLGLFDDLRKQARERLAANLPRWQRQAKMDVDGSCNREAMLAAMGKLMLNVLDDRPGEPVLFLPVRVGKDDETVPVRVTDLRIADRTLTVTVEPLTPAERKALLKRVREPYGPLDAGAVQTAP